MIFRSYTHHPTPLFAASYIAVDDDKLFLRRLFLFQSARAPRRSLGSLDWLHNLTPRLKLNHLFKTTQDFRRDFATNGDEVSHREPKAPQGLVCPSALLRSAVSEKPNPVPCKVRNHTG